MTDCLDEIESLFLSENHNSRADYIAGLRRLYRYRLLIADREEFGRSVTAEEEISDVGYGFDCRILRFLPKTPVSDLSELIMILLPSVTAWVSARFTPKV